MVTRSLTEDPGGNPGPNRRGIRVPVHGRAEHGARAWPQRDGRTLRVPRRSPKNGDR